MMAVTTLANGTSEGSTSHEVVRLREWGTDRIRMMLPRSPPRDHLVRTSETRKLQLIDLHESAQYVRLSYDGRHWWIRDLGGEHGLRQDGVPREEFLVVPGVEIGVGATTLIAESSRCIALREFCTRMIGRNRDPAVVDHALRAIRLAMTRRTALILRGDGDLVALAYALHRRTLGVDCPFVVCDRRRRSVPASVRSPANRHGGLVALEAATGGSLCLRSSRPPRDLAVVMARLRQADPPVQLVVCLDGSDRGALFAGPGLIEVPSLQDRTVELPQIVEEYAAEAIHALYAPAWGFAPSDLAWVIENAATSLVEIEKATLRVVALNLSFGNVTEAAERLGMAPVSLSRWLNRRSTNTLAPPKRDRARHFLWGRPLNGGG